MGPKKKGKSSSSNSSSSKPDRGKAAAADDTRLLQLEDVRSMWAATPRDGRLKLLTLDRQALIQRAEQLCATAGPAYDDAGPLLKDVLAEGLAHLESRGTWKFWRFGGAEFMDSDSFRSHIRQQHIPQQLLHLLPKDDPRGPERPAEAALRQRMTDLLQQVQLSSGPPPNVSPEAADKLLRDSSIKLIAQMLLALEKEDELLYQSLLQPITAFICDVLPEGMRKSTCHTFDWSDLERLGPDEAVHMYEWLVERLAAFSTRLKVDPREDEADLEDRMGSVDLFALTPDGTALTVSSKWLQHLEERLMDKDAYPRKAGRGDDPHRMGLVLEWIYGRIVSTAEKARCAAKCQLGLRPPSAQQAHIILLRCLEQQAELEACAKACKDLLSAMLDSRKEADELSKQHNIQPVPAAADAAAAGGAEGAEAGAGSATAAAEDAALPDAVIMKLLAREMLLTSAKQHALALEYSANVKVLNNLLFKILFGEPELERLKRELEELKHAPRCLEGTFRTAAEMERHRHQLADAAIKEQLEVQAAFREQSAKLQSLYDKKQRMEFEISKREDESKKLQGWKATMEDMLGRFDDLVHQKPLLQELPLLQKSPRATMVAASQTVTLSKLRQHFHKDVRKQLYSEADDRSFFNRIKDGLRRVEEQLEIGRVAVQHLELSLVNLACDDPGPFIGAQLALPMLQERLSRAVVEFRERLANEVLMLEQEEKAARSSASSNSNSKKAGKKTKQARRSPANQQPAAGAAAAVATGAAGERGDGSTDDDTAVSQQDMPAEAGPGTVIQKEPATATDQGPDDAGWMPIRGRGQSSDSDQQPASGNAAAASLTREHGQRQQQQQQPQDEQKPQQAAQQQAAQQHMPQPSPVPLVQQLPVSAQQQAAQQVQHRQAPASMWQGAVPSGRPATAATAQAHKDTAGLQHAVFGAPYRPPDIAMSAVFSTPYRPLLPTHVPSTHSHNTTPSSSGSSSSGSSSSGSSSSSRDVSAGVLKPAAADSPVAAIPTAVVPSSAAGAEFSASTVSAAAGVRRSRKQPSRCECREECVLCLDAPRTHGLMHPQAAEDGGGEEFSIHRCLCAACAATYDYEKQGCLVCGQQVTIKPVRVFL